MVDRPARGRAAQAREAREAGCAAPRPEAGVDHAARGVILLLAEQCRPARITHAPKGVQQLIESAPATLRWLGTR